MCKKRSVFLMCCSLTLANVSAAPNEAATGAMRACTEIGPSKRDEAESRAGAMCARTEVGGVRFTYKACPCVRCMATTSPHAGLASCIAPVVAPIAPANYLLYSIIRTKVDTFETERFDTFKKRSFLTHKKNLRFCAHFYKLRITDSE